MAESNINFAILVEDSDGLTQIERDVADALWRQWADPENPAVLIHEDPRTVARYLRPFLKGQA